MINAYLEGLKDTWVSGNEVSKSLGQMEDYKIYISDLPESGDFNVVLLSKFKNDDMLAPNKERYDAFVAKFGAERQKQTNQKAQRDYPAMREITGDYRLPGGHAKVVVFSRKNGMPDMDPGPAPGFLFRCERIAFAA